MPRLLNLCPTPEAVGGVARIAAYTGALLEQRGWEVRTVFPGGSDEFILAQWSTEYGVELERHPSLHSEDRRYASTRELQDLRGLIRSTRPDAVLVHFGTQSVATRLVMSVRAAPVSVCVAYCHAAYPWAEWGPAASKVQRRTRFASAMCRAVIASSDAVARELDAAGVHYPKQSVITTGVRLTTRFSDRDEARRKLELPEDAFVVASVMRFVTAKAPHVFVEATAAMADQPFVVMQGDGPLKPEIQDLARARLGDRVRFFDKRTDVSAVYAACDVFALTSLNEGFPLVLQEAAAHGRPVVATDVGGVAQLVLDGETGFVVLPGNPAPVTVALDRLRTDDGTRERMGRAARARAESVFSDETTADRVDRLLRRFV